MSSDSKRIKNDDSSSSASSSHDSKSKAPLLPEEVQDVLQEGIREGYRNGYIDLGVKGIKDSMISELCEWLAKLEGKVKVLKLKIQENGNRLYGNPITSKGASILFNTLRASNSSIKQINFNWNKQIGDKCMKSLGEYIKTNSNFETILMNGNSVSDTGIEILATYAEDKSVPLLVKMVESSNIDHMDVLLTSINQRNVAYCSLACNRIKNGASDLNLSGKDANDADIMKICEAMKRYGIDKLREIQLQHNKITSKGASMLLDTLKQCQSIATKLLLSNNWIDDEFMKRFGEYMQDDEHLVTVNIGSNVTDKGIEILSENLIGNTKLNTLYLNNNKGITDESVPNLIEMVKKSCITILYVDYTSVSEERKQEIDQVLKIPIDQREIPIKSSSKSAAKISQTHVD